MKPYSKNDSRFKIGQQIMIITGRASQDDWFDPIRYRARIIEVTDNIVKIENTDNEKDILLKHGGGFFFVNNHGEII